MDIQATKVVTVVLTMDGHQADELYKLLDVPNDQLHLISETAFAVKNEIMKLIKQSAEAIK